MKILGIVIAMTALTSAEGDTWYKRPSSQFIFHAVLEGLYEDGVSNAVIDSIIPAKGPDGQSGFSSSFVYACPLCHPTFEAMRLYRTRDEFMGQKNPVGVRGVDSFGKGLPKPLEDRLLSADEKIRRPALQELVQRHVSRRIERMRLTEAERDELARGIEEGRKYGEKSLKNSNEEAAKRGIKVQSATWMNCAVCEGSFGACQTKPAAISVAPSKP